MRTRVVVAVAVAVAVAVSVAGYGVYRFQTHDAAPPPVVQVELASSASLDNAIEFVKGESEWIADYERRMGTRHIAERVMAISLMNYIQVNVSTARLGWLRDLKRAELPNTADEVLAMQAGLCGGATTAFTAVMDELGVRTRRVSAWWIHDEGREIGHTFPEVWWEGDWHLIDPTWGAYWHAPDDRLDVLSFEELRAGEPRQLVVNEARLWFGESKANGYPHWGQLTEELTRTQIDE